MDFFPHANNISAADIPHIIKKAFQINRLHMETHGHLKTVVIAMRLARFRVLGTKLEYIKQNIILNTSEKYLSTSQSFTS
jgi:hypothetical protein